MPAPLCPLVKCADPPLREGRKGRVYLLFVLGIQDINLPLDGASYIPNIVRLFRGIRILWVHEHADRASGGHQFAQCSHSLRFQGDGNHIDTRCVAARTVKSRNQAKSDGIVTDSEHNRNGRGCGLGRQCCRSGDRNNDGHLPLDQLDCQSRHSSIVVRNAVFDRDVFAFGKARFAETLAKCGQF